MTKHIIDAWAGRVFKLRHVVIWVLTSAILAAAGPFGSYGMGLPVLLPLWLSIIGASLLIAALVMAVREVAFPDVAAFPAEMASCLAFTLLFAPVLWGILALQNSPEPAQMSLVGCFASVYFISTLISAVRLSIQEGTAEDAPATEARPAPRLLSRLDGDSGPVLRLSGKDHIVEVVTATEVHHIRMRLCDAVSEMDGVEGFFTHRSHWVARSAIQDVARDGARHFVEASDGERIPVSKGKLPVLAEAGLV